MNTKKLTKEQNLLKHKHRVSLINGYEFTNIEGLQECPAFPEFVELIHKNAEHYPLINKKHIWFIGEKVKLWWKGEEFGNIMNEDFINEKIESEIFYKLNAEKDWRSQNE